MFSAYHFTWLVISLIVILVTLRKLKDNKTPLKKLLIFSIYAGVLVELIKIFSLVQMVPNAEGTAFYPYIETQHFPLNICGMQKFLIAYVVFTKNEEHRDNLLAFIYPTGLIGAFIALIIPAGASIEWSIKGAFLNPQAYQFFLYHALLVIVGAYIPLSGEFQIKRKHYITSLSILGFIGGIAMYLNSIFANATYKNGQVVSVDYVPNYLFTYKPPIDSIKLTELWHWYLYIAVLLALVCIVLLVFYEPLIRKNTVKQKIS